MLPLLSGEFGIVKDPELTFSQKGNARLKLRIAAKDRVRDAQGQWADGDPWYSDLIVWGKTAENLAESIRKGDSIVVANAKAEQYEWTDQEGNKRQGYNFVADSVGVSMRWCIAKTPRAAESDGIAVAKDALGGTEMPPF